MIKLISCSDRDMGMYYQGTILYDSTRSKYVFVIDINTRVAKVQDETGENYIVSPNELLVDLPPTQYTIGGCVIGIECQRSYKRGYTHSGDVIDALLTLNSEFRPQFNKESGGYVGKLFYLRLHRGILVLEYKQELCGIFKDDVFYLRDGILAARLLEEVEGDYEVVVQ